MLLKHPIYFLLGSANKINRNPDNGLLKLHYMTSYMFSVVFLSSFSQFQGVSIFNL